MSRTESRKSWICIRPAVLLRRLGTGMLFLFLTSLINAQTVNSNALSSYEKGLEAFNQDLLNESIRLYQEAIEANPNFMEAHREAARAFFYLGEYDEALNYILEARRLSPRHSATLVLYGRVLVSLNRLNEAEQIFADIVAREPYNMDARLGLGELSVARGNIVGAQELYRRSMEINAEDRRILLSLAFIYLEQGRENEAEEFILAALDSDSENHWVYHYAAEFYMLIGDAEKALESTETALALYPGFLPSLEIMSRVLLYQGDYLGALEILSALETRMLDDPLSAMYSRGLAQYRSGDSRSALQTLGALLREDPEDEIGRLLLESILLSDLDFDDPLRDFYASHHFLLAEEYIQRNRFQTARYHFMRGLNLSPFNAAGRRAYARYFRESGDYSRYVHELKLLRDALLVSDTALLDELEVYEDVIRDTVASEWNIEQFEVERSLIQLGVFITPGSDLEHPGSELYLARGLMDQLFASNRLRFSSAPGLAEIEYSPVEVEHNARAFLLSRQAANDYYLLLSIDERDDSLLIEAGLHLGRTGRELAHFRVLRSGNGRVRDALLQLSSELLEALPLRGALIARSFEKGVVNLGSEDGLAAGEEFSLLPGTRLVLDTMSPVYSYDTTEVTGVARILRTDLYLSEVEVIQTGFFDRIRIGDAAIPVEGDEEDAEQVQDDGAARVVSSSESIADAPSEGLFSPIFDRLRSLR